MATFQTLSDAFAGSSPISEEEYNKAIQIFCHEDIFAFATQISHGYKNQELEAFRKMDDNGTISYNEAYTLCHHFGCEDEFERCYESFEESDRVDLGELLVEITKWLDVM